MKSTGITRRIDNLGRIVLPKEVRRKLKIKENDELEIFIEDCNIILKKYSSLDDMINQLEEYANLLKDITNFNVLITNKYKIKMCNKSIKNDYLDKELCEDIQDEISKNKLFIKKEDSNIEFIENISLSTKYLINPIINNGDLLGSIILFEKKNIDDKEIIATQIISKLITNYIS